MQTNAKTAGAVIAAVLGAAGIAASTTVLPFEDWRLSAYPDPAYGVKLATACAGVTRGIQLGVKYTQEDCQARTAQALIETGFAIAKCLPLDLPANTRASYTSMAYNTGPPKFCKSDTAALARAGNLPLSCVRMNTKADGSEQWVFSNGIRMKGLVRRRICERSLCESGILNKPPPVCK